MSGICDTCQRNQVCRRPMDGMDSCRLYVSGRESNYEKLFGTPERAAQTMALMCECSPECSFCLLSGRAETICGNGDYDTLLEWLRGEGEGE